MPNNKKAYPTQNCVFVVLDLDNRLVRYCGLSVFEAAEASEPGTCYGFGETEVIARRMAFRIANRCDAHEAVRRTNGQPS